MVVAGCAGSAKPAENPAENSGLITLDQALNEAANRIDERIPAESKIAPLNFNSPHDKFSDYVLEELTVNLVDSRKLTVVDRREIDLIRNEFDFQFSGEVGDDSMQQIGRMLGAQSIISGNFTDMGGFIRIMIRVLNVQNASVEVQYRANIVSDTVTMALLTGGRKNAATTMSRQTASPAGTQTTVSTASNQPATPAAPMRFTVTFNANGASGTAPSVQTVQHDESIIIPDVGTMTNSRGTFSGWNTRADGNGTPYAVGGILVVNSNVQLFARWVEPVYNIGDTGPAGGFIFYDKGNNTGGWRYLEAAPSDLGKAQWQSAPRYVDGTKDNIGSGKQNTQLIGDSSRATLLCQQYNLGGFRDWFLPSKAELDLMYINLKLKDLGNFSDDFYWSSSDSSSTALIRWDSAWSQRFNDGHQDGGRTDNKIKSYSVRAIRQF